MSCITIGIQPSHGRTEDVHETSFRPAREFRKILQFTSIPLLCNGQLSALVPRQTDAGCRLERAVRHLMTSAVWGKHGSPFRAAKIPVDSIGKYELVPPVLEHPRHVLETSCR